MTTWSPFSKPRMPEPTSSTTPTPSATEHTGQNRGKKKYRASERTNRVQARWGRAGSPLSCRQYLCGTGRWPRCALSPDEENEIHAMLHSVAATSSLRGPRSVSFSTANGSLELRATAAVMVEPANRMDRFRASCAFILTHQTAAPALCATSARWHGLQLVSACGVQRVRF
jgi:hypothetical protein